MKAIKIDNFGEEGTAFPLQGMSEAAQAHRLLEWRQSVGKIVLKVIA